MVGGEASLGLWSPKRGLQMNTNAATFPWWSSETVALPANQLIEFKFVICKEGEMTPITWESFQGNRSMNVAVGSPVTMRSTWDDQKSIMVPSPSKLSSEAPASPDSLVPEGGNPMRRTASASQFVVAEMETMKSSINQREPMRRNFSQSLFGVDEPAQAKVESSNGTNGATTKAPAAAAAIAAAVAEAPSGEPRKTVSLKHVSSFSALTEVADSEVKEETWKRHKKEYEPYNLDVPIVIVTSEIAPWSKTGGLGLVALSYSEQFARNGHRTMAVSPKYREYEGIKQIGETRVLINNNQEVVTFWHKFIEYGEGKGCDYIFIGHPSIQRDGGLYNGEDGREYGDNLFRFTLLSAAAMEAPLILNIGGTTYGDKVIFLANDWQAGLVPLYLCYKYRRNKCYMQSRCIYAVHNLGYQGMYPHINASSFFSVEPQAANDLALGNCVNLCKGALICADRVITVSPNYATEIQTKEGGFGLEGFVRGKAHGLRLSGILNGIDDCWNPSIDKKLFRNFDLADFEAGKLHNKVELQRRLGLRQEENVVLVGFVGRLTWQKGVDVLAEIIDWLMTDTGNGVTGRVQLIMMGQGEEKYASALRWAETNFKGRACGYVGFDPAVEHQMMAGCDLFLMPSRYEPCGLPQMYAQRYGTLPVVHATGGLVDSVVDVAKGVDTATGFHIPYMAADKMKEVLYKAMEMYLKRPVDFKTMQRTAMQQDYYWPKAMDEYEKNIDYTLYDPASVR